MEETTVGVTSHIILTQKIHDSLNRRMKGETHEKFENISQSSRENRLHPTVAVRGSDSYFDCDISAAWLHVIRSKPRKDGLAGTGG